MTSTTVFKFTVHEHRNLLCRCPQHRIPGGRRHRADTITSATHAVDELVCNTSYEFRVSAYADGDTTKTSRVAQRYPQRPESEAKP